MLSVRVAPDRAGLVLVLQLRRRVRAQQRAQIGRYCASTNGAYHSQFDAERSICKTLDDIGRPIVAKDQGRDRLRSQDTK